MTDRIVFRQSDIKTWKRCGRKAWLGTFRNLNKIRVYPNKTHIGTAVHAGVAAYYSGHDGHQAIAEQFEIWDAAGFIDPEDMKVWNETRVMADLMYQGYIEWVANEAMDHGLEFFIVEQRFEKLVGVFNDLEVYITGQIDIGSLDDLGMKRMYDTKTKGDLKRLALLEIDDQLLTYDWLTDYQFDYGVHNMMKRSKRTQRATPPFYAREEVPFTAEVREAFLLRMNGTVQRMVDAYQQLEQDPRQHFSVAEANPTKDCSWECPFFDACPMFDLGDDAEGFIAENYRQKVEADG